MTTTHGNSIALMAAPLSLALLLALGTSLAPPPEATDAPPTASYIVQSESVAEATRLVEEAGATITHELGIINAVGVVATLDQVEALQSRAATLRIYPNQIAAVAKKGGSKGGNKGGTKLLVDPDSVYPPWSVPTACTVRESRAPASRSLFSTAECRTAPT